MQVIMTSFNISTRQLDDIYATSDQKFSYIMMMMGLVSAAEAGGRGGAVPGAGHGERRGAARLSTGGHSRYTAATCI